MSLNEVTSTPGRAVVIGSVGLDIVAPRLESESGSAAAGNTGSNIAVRLADRGWDVTLIACIGDDPAGELLLADCVRWGVNPRGLIATPGYNTPIVRIISDGSGPSEILPRPSMGEGLGPRPLQVPSAGDVPQDVLADVAEADLIIFDVPSANSVELCRRNEQGLIWYEASMYEASAEDISAAGEIAHVIKCSDEELWHYATLFDAPRDQTVLTIVTAGGTGTRAGLRQADGRFLSWSQPARPVDPVDTVGAGDAFTAACAARLAHMWSEHDRLDPANLERTVREAIAAGQEAGTSACLAVGARGDMVTSARISSGAALWIAEDIPFVPALSHVQVASDQNG